MTKCNPGYFCGRSKMSGDFEKKDFLEQKFFSFALKSTPRKFQDDTLTVEKLFTPPGWTLKFGESSQRSLVQGIISWENISGDTAKSSIGCSIQYQKTR